MHLPLIMLSQMYVQIGKMSLEASAKDYKKGKQNLPTKCRGTKNVGRKNPSTNLNDAPEA